MLIAGTAALVAGAMSMAAGEYVSVSSQADAEKADLAIERRELSDNAAFEHRELADIYVKRGLDRELAQLVADQLMKKDALAAHARDELGISDATRARPVQAAFASAGAFTAGAALPLLTVIVSPAAMLVPVVSAASLVFLALLGAIGAQASGANVSARDGPRDVLGRSRAGVDRRDRRADWDRGLSLRPQADGPGIGRGV